MKIVPTLDFSITNLSQKITKGILYKKISGMKIVSV